MALSDANTEKRHVLKCRCGCGIITFEKEKKDKYYEQDVLYIEYYPIAFYAHQHPIRERIRAIWNLIRGKEYRLFDIVANYDEFREVVEEMDME